MYSAAVGWSHEVLLASNLLEITSSVLQFFGFGKVFANLLCNGFGGGFVARTVAGFVALFVHDQHYLLQLCLAWLV